MPRGPHRLFASRRITLAGVALTIVTVLVGFGIGVAAGWGTSLFADRLQSTPSSPSPSPSESGKPTVTPTIDVSVPPLEPVLREIDDDDKAAGLRTLDFPYRGEGTFSPVPAQPATTPDAGVVQYVRIDVEDGLQMINGTLSVFVMSALNDPQGWGKEGPTTYVQTEGAPDIRVIFASPVTAAALCPTPHEPASLAPVETSSPSPDASPSPTPTAIQCADHGAIVVSVYDWIQGLGPFAADRNGARAYLLNHGLGHVLGKADDRCKKGVAAVMVDQRELPAKCKPNPWPFPSKD